MGVFSWFRRKPSAPVPESGAGAVEAASEAPAGAEAERAGAGTTEATAEDGAAAEVSGATGGESPGRTDIPRQQSAGAAADGGTGEGART
ncbi:hypothetical protein [Streptomyces sp. NPDC093225]|uniref:hypothetical protein n=1 Tax=Streptomyces sp. NPDC093225 TaxID=3366034 RepID=UPI00380D28D9